MGRKKTGRRPLQGPPARLGRALCHKTGGRSIHTPGPARGWGRGEDAQRPGGPWRGVITGRRASGHFLPDWAGTKHGGCRGLGEVAVDLGCFGEPRTVEGPWIAPPRTRVNRPAYTCSYPLDTVRGRQNYPFEGVLIIANPYAAHAAPTTGRARRIRRLKMRPPTPNPTETSLGMLGDREDLLEQAARKSRVAR